MKVLVAIPSYNRPYDIERKCLYWLKQLHGIDWKVFVREEQVMYYEQNLSNNHIVPIHVSNYRETINAIGEYARSNGYDLIHRVDDDMGFKKLGKSKKANVPEVYMEAYHNIVKKFKSDPNLFGVSISKPREHMRSKDKVWVRENKCMYGNQWWIPNIVHLPEGIELFDDVYFTLKILDQGGKTLTYSGAYEDAELLKNAGGLQSINRNALSRATIKEMSKIFPNVREGHYKDQTDVVDIDLKALGIK